jgi:hypothetical protein
MQIPHLKNFRRAKEFFREFYRLNQPNLSQRNIASKLDWPASFLGDVMQGRKHLTVNRAVEFARFFNLNGVECEYLIMLALKEVNNPAVREYAENYLNTEGFPFPTDPHISPELSKTDENTPHFIPEDTYCDTDYMILHSFIAWSNGTFELHELPNLLPAYPAFRDGNYVLNILARMRDDGIIAGEPPALRLLKPNLVVTDFTGKSIVPFLELFKRVQEITPEKVFWQTGSLIFPICKVRELHAKIRALRSWALMTSVHDKPKQDGRCMEHTILHFNLSTYGNLTRIDSRSESRPIASDDRAATP